ncbi:alanine racemase [Chelatococcus sp. SYSU_G07232]|uniref:Alanine racemase n=1 Tax=Chelatococcus albus TaxID=3047466 RepID=A0ABT7AKR5_9HYPH|nr:alanine racemase [Chelatococcus sp. SYSU_G07232]MDJ1159966.1 alanine racemase [Chelatococcus sp. SYSU_G07232]
MTILDLDPILASAVDGRTKGLPPDSAEMPLAAVARQGWNVLRGDLPFPQAVLKQGVMRRNAEWMRDFVGRAGVDLAPHGKTTMAPQIYDLQLAAGAWGITVATAQQARVAVAAGARRVIVANEVVDRASIAALGRLLAADPGLILYALVDSVAGVMRLAEALPAHPGLARLGCLVELGVAGGRTGCRSPDQAAAVARAVRAAGLTLAGVEGYEGVIGNSGTADENGAVRRYLRALTELSRRLDADGLFAGQEILVTAGGSGCFDLVVEGLSGPALSRPVRIVLRSGCYITHDSVLYERLFAAIAARAGEALPQGRLAPALEIWAMVQSVPEPGRAIVTMGKRDVGFDAHLPVPTHLFREERDSRPVPLDEGFRVSKLFDQHACLDLPAGADLRVGDLVACGISHPCTTFDRWQVLMVVDDGYTVVDAVRTFF